MKNTAQMPSKHILGKHVLVCALIILALTKFSSKHRQNFNSLSMLDLHMQLHACAVKTQLLHNTMQGSVVFETCTRTSHSLSDSNS
jgi:hypothetical protein